MEDLKIVNADNLLYTSLDETEFIIEDILPIGLHIFCGAPKVGKSWLMLDICIKVSKGEEIYIVSEDKNFVKVRTNDGLIGYIKASKIENKIQEREDFFVENRNISNENIKEIDITNKDSFDLIKEQGKATVNEITKAAGYNRCTFYRYFSDSLSCIGVDFT